MGAVIMTLLEVVQKLNILDEEDTIYATKPWTENSTALVMPEPESGELSPEIKELGVQYFIEVFIAKDFINDWIKTQNKPSYELICFRLIEFVMKDA